MTAAPVSFWRNPWVVATIAGVLALTALRACPSRSLAPLPILNKVKPFKLLDQEGREVTEASLAGRPYLVSFFFTSCRTVCPDLMRSVREVQGHLASQPAGHAVRLLSVSVDPGHDTPAALLAYAKQHNLDLARWSLLTGARPDVEAFVVGNLATAMGERETQPGGLIDIAHSMKIVLVDADGHIRHYFSSTRPEDLVLAAAYASQYAEEALKP